ncbi:MAG: trimeric intracellular cation channel family protein [Clostridia bacterium]|nr:trimeric intracellular cation channel family protein [Clostridia bacterium]
MDINWIYLAGEWIGTAAFAVSGAMVAVNKRNDIFGVLLLAIFTALGGGVIRDMLIGDLPPRIFGNFHYVLLAMVCALLVFFFARINKDRFLKEEKHIEKINNIFDAIGLGVFAVNGARIGLDAGFGGNIFMLTTLGMVTAVGGGMLRDVLIREMPFVLSKRVYAVAAICGALVFSVLVRLGVSSVLAYGIGWAITTMLRLLATAFRWNLPKAF